MMYAQEDQSRQPSVACQAEKLVTGKLFDVIGLAAEIWCD